MDRHVAQSIEIRDVVSDRDNWDANALAFLNISIMVSKRGGVTRDMIDVLHEELGHSIPPVPSFLRIDVLR